MSVKVSESTGYGPNTQMSLFGYIMAAVLVIILLPLLPVLAVVWVLWKVFVSDEELEHSFETWRREADRSSTDRLEAADDDAETDEDAADDA
ncbi:hypothetical protein E2L06_09565 [Haloterrigena sp. H1]|uniref:DUF7535 family protein n=1 Tax=Haloterrigena sp. H1 TaxID=2552943 RepID=UPI00110EFC30|nr:hypothetical protein [Haloterrigena sp. H1]TMT86834.1 hypothetical protein E2L06_09565 [Haloterrigena sp. H1]